MTKTLLKLRMKGISHSNRLAKNAMVANSDPRILTICRFFSSPLMACGRILGRFKASAETVHGEILLAPRPSLLVNLPPQPKMPEPVRGARSREQRNAWVCETGRRHAKAALGLKEPVSQNSYLVRASSGTLCFSRSELSVFEVIEVSANRIDSVPSRILQVFPRRANTLPCL